MEAISKPNRVRRKIGRTSDSRRNQKRSPEVAAFSHPTSGFLNYRFKPQIKSNWPYLNKKQTTEQSFFKSLNHFYNLYPSNYINYSSEDYPYNIYLSFKEAEVNLSLINEKLELLIVEKEPGNITLATKQTADTGRSLFYIPILPIVQIINNKKKKRLADIIVSTCAWLYQIVLVDDYINGTFLDGVHESIENWLTDCEADFPEDEYKEQLQEVADAKTIGKEFFKIISSKKHIQLWEKRLSAFEPKSESENALLSSCIHAWIIYSEYPNRNAFTHVQKEEFDYNPDEDDDHGVYLHQFLSFCWNNKGVLNDNVNEWVNVSFQEGVVHDPTTIQLFDTHQSKETHDLDFENRLFDFISDFIFALNELQ